MRGDLGALRGWIVRGDWLFHFFLVDRGVYCVGGLVPWCFVWLRIRWSRPCGWFI